MDDLRWPGQKLWQLGNRRLEVRILFRVTDRRRPRRSTCYARPRPQRTHARKPTRTAGLRARTGEQV